MSHNLIIACDHNFQEKIMALSGPTLPSKVKIMGYPVMRLPATTVWIFTACESAFCLGLGYAPKRLLHERNDH